MNTCPVCENDMAKCQCNDFRVGDEVIAVLEDGKTVKGKVVALYINRGLFDREFRRYQVCYYVNGQAVYKYFPKSRLSYAR